LSRSFNSWVNALKAQQATTNAKQPSTVYLHGNHFQSRQEFPALPARRYASVLVRGICGRLIYLQIFRYGSFVKQAEHQQQREIPLSAKRGVIYDRAGHELAMSVLVDSAFAVPSEVKDLPTAVSLITRITGEDHNVVLADCRNHKTFCWVARKADDETIERIKSLNLQGIHFQKEPKRFYPARDLAAQVVGTVGMEDAGQSGIEHEFDDELRGRAGKCSSRWTRAGNGSPTSRSSRKRAKTLS
jgi:cell division protein FtsI/penicillin-binding protein 2